MFDKIKLFFSAVQMYLWIAVGVIILGQGFFIYLQNKDLDRKDLEYKLLLGQHSELAGYVGIQNAAIDKIKIDEAKANKKFETAKASIKQTYQALVDKYKNTPKDKQCEIIIEQNRKYYEEDKGVGYEDL